MSVGAVFAALFAAHVVADHWVQTDFQALHKGDVGADSWRGRLACARHVASYMLVAAVALVAVWWRAGLDLSPVLVVIGLGFSAVTHWVIDRRWTLASLIERAGKGPFAAMGGPLGGGYLLDQAAHVACLFVAALVIG